MVRLVFRPYIQVWRTICTSVSLRASTRVSPGFTLLKYSSPSFGSQQVCSHSNFSPQIKAGRQWYDNAAVAFTTPTSIKHADLHMCMDSLVRVSRRVMRNLANHHEELENNRSQTYGDEEETTCLSRTPFTSTSSKPTIPRLRPIKQTSWPNATRK